MLKRIDILVVRSFIGPFLLTFFISLLIIVMQFLWKYIDDLVGKGLEWTTIVELIFYASASFVPLALPLAILLSSIMTFGAMGEHYELVALKANGISLLRFMRPLFLVSVVLMFAAFHFNNRILPYSNLKFRSLLYDITQQKPALNIKPGVFYHGIEGFSIRVGEKGEDNRSIFDVMVYDLSAGKGNQQVLLAKRGEMFSSEDERFLHLKLYDGRQYQELLPEDNRMDKRDFVRIEFKSWEKIFDMSQFSMSRSDEGFWKNHYQMMTIRMLNQSMDSIQAEIQDKVGRMKDNISQFFAFKRAEKPEIQEIIRLNSKPDSICEPSYYQKLLPDSLHSSDEVWVNTAVNHARNVKSYVNVTLRDQQYRQRNLLKHRIEWHRKFTLSFACIVLLLVGAPLGAIIRKGGLGMPMMMSIIFFVIFHVFSMAGEKIAEEGVWSPIIGMWLASSVLLPIGLFLTYKAMNDSQLFQWDLYARFWQFKGFRKTAADLSNSDSMKG